MKNFALKLGLFLSPFILLIGLFFYWDPYMLRGIRSKDMIEAGNVELNSDFLTMENYLANRQKAHYNTFIFGSSRSEPFLFKYWIPYLKDTTHISPFLFSHRGGEGVAGLYEKVVYIDKVQDSLKNALIIMNRNTFELPPTLAWYKLHDYRLSGEPKAKIWWEAIKVYFSKGLFIRHIDFKLFHTKRAYMSGYLKSYGAIDSTNSNSGMLELEQLMLKDSVNYYEKQRKTHFYPRDITQNIKGKSYIKPQDIEQLKAIKQIFDKHQTAYKIVFVPLYDGIAVNTEDLSQVQSIFGANNVHDFSGINAFSNSKYYFMDVDHVRPRTAKWILDSIYSTQH